MKSLEVSWAIAGEASLSCNRFVLSSRISACSASWIDFVYANLIFALGASKPSCPISTALSTGFLVLGGSAGMAVEVVWFKGLEYVDNT